MHQASICVFISVILLYSTSIQASPVDVSGRYFPNQPDDVLTYQNDYSNVVTDEIDRDYYNWHRHTYWGGFDQIWLKSTDDNKLHAWSNQQDNMLVDFDDPEGSRYPVQLGSCNLGEIRISNKNETLSLPAGLFTEVIRLDFSTSCADGGVLSHWYAREVGLIQWEEQSIAGPVTSRFIAGTIGGITYPQEEQKGVQVTGQSDRYNYRSYSFDPTDGEPFPIPPVQAARFDLTIVNHSGSDIAVKFTSSQQFEIQIINEEGQVLSTWSNGRVFLDVETETSLQDGDVWSFGDFMGLIADDGTPLPEGEYRVSIFTTSTPSWKVVLPIHIYPLFGTP